MSWHRETDAERRARHRRGYLIVAAGMVAVAAAGLVMLRALLA